MVPLGLYTGQLVLNWAWPPIFFGTRQMGLVSVACRWPMVGWAPLGGHGASHPRRGQGLKAGAGLQLSVSISSAALGDQCPPPAAFASAGLSLKQTGLLAWIQGPLCRKTHTAPGAMHLPHWVRSGRMFPFYTWGN